MNLTLQLLLNNFAICKLAPDMEIPSWLNSSSLFSITRTSDELSIVCEDSIVPPGICTESGWACLKVVGTLDFSLIGILASLINPLVEAKISIFALSTYNTDYILIKKDQVDKAIEVLKRYGHIIKC